MEQSKQKKSISKAALLGLLVAVVLVFLCLLQFKPATEAGTKDVTIEVVDDQGTTMSYEVKTDAEYLQQAMDEAKDLTYSGEESEYGLMVTTVNGLRAVYETDGAYWAFYVNGEYCNYGIGEQPVKDEDVFKIEYTPAQ